MSYYINQYYYYVTHTVMLIKCCISFLMDHEYLSMYNLCRIVGSYV